MTAKKQQKTIEVEALSVGYYGNLIRKKGDKFTMTLTEGLDSLLRDGSRKTWVRKV